MKVIYRENKKNSEYWPKINKNNEILLIFLLSKSDNAISKKTEKRKKSLLSSIH